ncbi:MAG: translation elongation factor Ts [Holosporales bacterium]|jgi:elongation factor Ts|nr:translation elongation factor Ts [Holosporales bacterium]
MEISATLVKQLRDKTGAGMMDCKRALIESNGNMQAAEELLRKKGLMAAAKKSSHVAAEGLVAVAVANDKMSTAIVEINSETDFVARNDKFQALVGKVANIALETDDVMAAVIDGKPLKDEIDMLNSIVGENISIRRHKIIKVENGVIGTYVHGAVCPGMGKIGVAVAMESSHEFDKPILIEFGRKIAMHIAAANPAYLCQCSVPSDVISKEKEIAINQAVELGKPRNIAEKIAEGRIKKFYEERALMDQIFVIDGKLKVSAVIDEFNKETQYGVQITGFEKFVLGEGLKKSETAD